MLNWTIETIPLAIMSSTEMTILDINSTNLTNTTNTTDTESVSWQYREGIGILMLLCSLSMIVNTRVLLSVYWIKRPMSATLYISLSLAAADLITSLIVLINFILNSYLHKVMGVTLPTCVALVIEAFRLGGIVNTVLHLLLLACNHYVGIVRPLHYQSIMTHRKITGCLVALWVLPPAYMLGTFSIYTGEGFQNESCSHDFVLEPEFRLMYILLLLIPFALMTLIYTHILVMVRRQQRSWRYLAERGSSRHRGHEDPRHNQQMLRNIKALHTTLLILGSFVAGLLPPILVFVLVCDNCAFDPKGRYMPELIWFGNLLLVTKPLANPIIYAARMHEIKEATRRMRVRLCHGGGWCRCCAPLLPLLWLCCGWGYDAGHVAQRSSQRRDASDSLRLYHSGSQLCNLVNGHTKNVNTIL